MKFYTAIAGVIGVGLAVALGIAVHTQFAYTVFEAPMLGLAAATSSPGFTVTHIKTPPSVRGIYMSSWVAGDATLRARLVNLIDTTELNAVVIDIKDYTGRLSFLPEKDEELKKVGSGQNRVSDIKEFIGELHDKGIYVIGRISTFQDKYFVDLHPEYAVHTKAGAVWQDRKGVKWIDAGAEPMWNYITSIGMESYAMGFDELNFDYIRFPSDGNMEDIAYPYSHGKVKAEVLKDFFVYISDKFKKEGIPISADFFGMVTSNKDDLGIGQILENGLANFNYVSPMVYPSHYPATFNGWPNPNAVPYELIHYTLQKGIDRAIAASTTPDKIRPWLQDFSLGGIEYTPEMVRAEIKATHDVGLSSWLLWNAANHYSKDALEPEPLVKTE